MTIPEAHGRGVPAGDAPITDGETPLAAPLSPETQIPAAPFISATSFLEEKHKFATRWYHWVNFPILTAMIFSGMLVYWPYDPYRIGIGSFTLFHFFPERFYSVTGIGHQLARGMALHFALAWVFALNGIAYVLYTLISGEWRELAPQAKSFREAAQVALHDMGFKVPMPPQGRYNAAQRISYSAIVVMGGFSLITGLAIYKPAQLHWLTAAVGGYEWARFEHFWLTLGYVGFFVIHIAQVIRAGWANFRAMVTGYDLVSAPAAEKVEAPTHAE